MILQYFLLIDLPKNCKPYTLNLLMDYNCTYTSYKSTNFFSKIVVDYLSQATSLQPFYKHLPNKDGILNAIAERKSFNTDRQLLLDYFKQQYGDAASIQQQKNIELLSSGNCFTITTAHQPNIFTGPLYFIYKILHAVKLAQELNIELSDYNFVPVYYMGSEDADLDELGNITIQEKKITWNTQQTGAVGRMKVDKSFLQLIHEIESQIGVNEFGNELSSIFKQCYTFNKTIQQATFELVNILFAEYGLLVLIPDNVDLKKAFIPTVTKELQEQFSRKEVDKTNEEFGKHYKIQAAGRELNLFYLMNDRRERIEKVEQHFIVQNLEINFSLDEILSELNNHPERFSANVILRPVFQETILPNIVFIGGGGELAYWLQLKKVFENAAVPYPVLVLRNSFLFYNTVQENKLQKMGYEIKNTFLSTEELFVDLVKKQSQHNLSLQEQIEQVSMFYQQLEKQSASIDITLVAHTQAIAKKAIKKIEALEKKLLRAEKRKFADQKNQLEIIKKDLFPNNSLQERVENLSYLYSIFGKKIIEMVLSSSKGLSQEFGFICINKKAS